MRGWTHEWSTSVLAADYAGWDWMALRLDDGRDLMVFQMRRRDGARSTYDAGAVVDSTGHAKALSARDFSLQPLRQLERVAGGVATRAR